MNPLTPGTADTSEAPIWIEKGATARYNVPMRGMGRSRKEQAIWAIQTPIRVNSRIAKVPVEVCSSAFSVGVLSVQD